MEIVRLTVIAVLEMFYHCTTWVPGDGNKKVVGKLAQGIDCKYLSPKLIYQDDRSYLL